MIRRGLFFSARRDRDADRSVKRFCAALAAALCLAFGAPANAQTAQTPFSGFNHDAGEPIEVSAEAFRVDNANQIGIFTGTSEQPVDVRQGDVRLQAKEIRIYYNGGVDRPEGQDAIRRLEAIGEVFITNGKESAEAARADYDVAAAEIVMDGNVRLLQGESVMKGERLRIDLEAGTGRMEGGRVQVSINPARAGQ